MPEKICELTIAMEISQREKNETEDTVTLKYEDDVKESSRKCAFREEQIENINLATKK